MLHSDKVCICVSICRVSKPTCSYIVGYEVYTNCECNKNAAQNSLLQLGSDLIVVERMIL